MQEIYHIVSSELFWIFRSGQQLIGLLSFTHNMVTVCIFESVVNILLAVLFLFLFISVISFVAFIG